MLKFVTKEICSQCSCKKKLRFLLTNVETRKEVEDIFNKMGVIHPIRYDGHDICEQTNQEVLSKLNVKTSANILKCGSNLKIQRLL